mmetsp:Transcript_116987/g.239369  ORF Transcript_116987/g.239369 Transcript_116987/m.239369 type:complete len:212 (+) Transcript_116987:604-1239(+)
MATRVRPSNQVILESSTAVGGSIDLFVATRFGNTRRTAPNEFFSVGLCFVESDAVFCNVVPRIAGLALDPEGLDSGRFVSRSADASHLGILVVCRGVLAVAAAAAAGGGRNVAIGFRTKPRALTGWCHATEISSPIHHRTTRTTSPLLVFGDSVSGAFVFAERISGPSRSVFLRDDGNCFMRWQRGIPFARIVSSSILRGDRGYSSSGRLL